MHIEAKLIAGTGKIGSPGTLVKISTVEKVYKSSAAVKGVEQFACANPGCGVPVIAVITQTTKSRRTKSPSSHFRATPKKHTAQCGRIATVAAKPSTTASNVSTVANATKASAPTKWRAHPNPTTSGSLGGNAALNPSGTRNRATNTGATTTTSGTSTQSAQKVEQFAAPWQTFTLATRQSTELSAPWNKGGTYDSAFIDIASAPLMPSLLNNKRIFLGKITNVYHGTSGYTLTLNCTFNGEKHNGKFVEVRIWVQNAIQYSGPSGTAFWSMLSAAVTLTGRDVFALGEFSRESTGKGRFWYVLAVADGNDIWIP